MFNLAWKGVVDNKAMLGTRKGASGKTRIRAVPLTAESLAAIGQRGVPNKTVFTTASDMMWTKDKFYPFFYRATDSVGIEDFRPHDCRHTFASHLVQKGASLRAVAYLLGHSSLSMVMRYSHLAPSHLEDTVGLLGVSGAKWTHAFESGELVCCTKALLWRRRWDSNPRDGSPSTPLAGATDTLL